MSLKSKLEELRRVRLDEEDKAARTAIGYGPIRIHKDEGDHAIKVSIEVNGAWFVVIYDTNEYPDHTVYPVGMLEIVNR